MLHHNYMYKTFVCLILKKICKLNVCMMDFGIHKLLTLLNNVYLASFNSVLRCKITAP